MARGRKSWPLFLKGRCLVPWHSYRLLRQWAEWTQTGMCSVGVVRCLYVQVGTSGYMGMHSRWVWFHLHLRPFSTRAMGYLLCDKLSRSDGLEVPGKLLSAIVTPSLAVDLQVKTIPAQHSQRLS